MIKSFEELLSRVKDAPSKRVAVAGAAQAPIIKALKIASEEKLVEPVGETETVLHVADLTATDGSDEYELFVAGDTVLIEGEIVLVEAVNADDNTLTVQRSYVRPAASHEAGTRVAALITFWPGSWVMDISTYCPATIFVPEIGPETWAQGLARYDVEVAMDGDWDGILIDRSDPDESWLIGGSTARTIDVDRSNRLVTDYAEFDAAWNAGLRAYEADLRAAWPGQDHLRQLGHGQL